MKDAIPYLQDVADKSWNVRKDPNTNAERKPTLAEAFQILIEGGDVFPTYDDLKIKGVTADSEAAAGVARANAAKLHASYDQERLALIETHRDPRIGIALSGGGVRSASFAQGVLKGLHEAGILEKAGYLSTVSGGGYTGGWYMIHRKDDDVLFGDGSADLRHLSKSGKILDSGGVDSQTEVFVNSTAQWAVTLPFHLLVNGLFDLHIRTTGFRSFYRNGIRDSFLYNIVDNPEERESPLSSRTLGWCTPSVTNALRDASLHDDLPPAHAHRPVWIVNCHIALGNDYRFRNRTGDAFEITPFRAGADAVGYVDVPGPGNPGDADFEERKATSCPGRTASNFWMRNDYALAISGAAYDTASARRQDAMGKVRQGLNLNIGYVIDGWSRYWIEGDGGLHRRIMRKAFAWVPLISALLPQDARESDSVKYYITDGGHFENTGVYALVRRGCRLIICSDAGWDAKLGEWDRPILWDKGAAASRALAFEDVRTLEARINADFGAKLNVSWQSYSPSGSGPRTDYACLGSDEERRPDADSVGDGRILVATIDNVPIECAPSRVVILFVRMNEPDLTTTRGIFGTIDREKARDPAFGNDPTTDQFFSEDRVLAYRELGLEIVESNRKLIEWASRDLDAATPCARPIR